VAVPGLEVMRPEEHALVPVDRAVAHGNSACGSVGMGFILRGEW
jgi:hypothetical protein